MKNIILGLIVFVAAVDISLAADFQWQDISLGNREVTAVLASDSAGSIIIGSAGRILRYVDDAGDWRLLLSVRGDIRDINRLAADPSDKRRLYAATGNGLYISVDNGNSWKKSLKGKNQNEQACTGVAVCEGVVYLGTKGGLFISVDNGRLWHKANGTLGKTEIMNIDSAFGSVYVASADGVYLKEEDSFEWSKIYSAQGREVFIYEEGAAESREEDRSSLVNYICADSLRQGHLYLATAIGIYESQDNGLNWRSFDDYGLLSKDVRLLSLLPTGELFAATQKGIFRYDDGRWQELFFGANCDYVRCLSADIEGVLYAGCNNGLFKATQVAADATYSNDPDYSREPSIQKVQQAAIKYAEVEPEKIIRWRKQAAKKALLPKVTLSMDQDLNRTNSSNIWGTYSSNGTPGRHYAGPDDVTKYNNKSWGVSLSWELSDLVFSDDQTNIDVRSRLMVELRDDILDEVNKTYYERLRVKMELDELSLLDKKKRREKELRIQELSASLDSLTGGYFSRQIQNNKG